MMLIASCVNGDLATMNSNLVKGPPLTRQEVLLLIDLIREHSIIMSKQTNAGCNRLKEKAWQLVSEQFNAKIKSCPRRPYQLKLKWDNLKKSARRKAIKNQAEGYYMPLDDVLDAVLRLLEGASDSGDSNSSSSTSDERSEDRTRPDDAMEGKHGANLMRHFQHKHKEEFKGICDRNREGKLLMATESQALDSSALKDVLKNIEDSTLAVSSLPDEHMETLSINDDESENGSACEEEVEANREPPASDPLHTMGSSDRSSGSDSDSDGYEVPLASETLKQRSRVRRRRRNDVVRKNIAIAEYYEAKKMKVHLEIKKLQLEIDMRMNNRSDATNANTINSETNIKTESM